MFSNAPETTPDRTDFLDGKLDNAWLEIHFELKFELVSEMRVESRCVRSVDVEKHRAGNLVLCELAVWARVLLNSSGRTRHVVIMSHEKMVSCVDQALRQNKPKHGQSRSRRLREHPAVL